MAGLFNGESTYVFVCSCRWRGCFDYGRVDVGWLASLFILRKFNVGDMAPLYALFPVVMEWGTYCSPYYHLNSILSLVIVLYIFCGYIQIKVKWLSWVTGSILLFAVYCMVGSRLFIFVILVLLYEAEIGEKHWVYWALLLITGTVLPEFLKELYSLSEEQAYQFPRSLPAFTGIAGAYCVQPCCWLRKASAFSMSSGVSIPIVSCWVMPTFIL